MTFSAIRIPTSASFDECYGNLQLGKRYRRWRCYQGLGMDDPTTQFDDFNKSVVRWGLDQIRDAISEAKRCWSKVESVQKYRSVLQESSRVYVLEDRTYAQPE